ncbi:uncharacterized protein PHACADRAFT_152504 [Phanerochaete carnosa HHB-10118-sp]|uniref:AB hydrolase-1 domain-containing protein n=1 Tax=Phanerochaete carnosa (strain HHB-10118-sp) TaxID=650164 RepID=K5VV85_PHACS|nr:uncharacterized protein PHACADRAFT_152504 [Phanerochaete carnosa HHB-10118-sp]EKM50484.1 hypothetical protein PHACADRAFT_152504 [Phanerochaete carnosa HHB-10118-sp]
MIKTAYTIDLRPQLPFYTTGNRYQTDPPRNVGYTLILLHATGLHKETWEPVIQLLFGLSSKHSAPQGTIREAWAIECPNHGQSAVLNEKELEHTCTEEWDGWIYPRAVHAFLASSPSGLNLSEHKFIVAGHSMGGNAAVLLTALTPQLHIESVVLLDGTIASKSPERDHMDIILAQLVWPKPDVWRSRKDALRWHSSAPGFKSWDKAALELFVEYGLKAHPASKYPPPFTFKGVTLACNKSYEAACYRAKTHQEEAWEQLQHLHAYGPPVHVILSEKDEFSGAKLKQALLKGKYRGGAASVQYVENTSHMFPQQRPEATARALWKAIQASSERTPAAKL